MEPSAIRQIKRIGEGSFGCIFLARITVDGEVRETKDFVAIT
jgi:hypothetical protein